MSDAATPDAPSLGQVLSKEELRELAAPSDLRGAAILMGNWALAAFAFAIAIIWPNPLTILAGVVILGGRQLGFSVLMHDCAHRVHFKNKWANDVLGQWLCAGPMGIPQALYRDYHLAHHRHAGTENDPDLGLIKHFPIPKDSLRRKLTRDITGRTGWRDTKRKLANMDWKRDRSWVAFHAVLLTALTLAGAPWAYLMWWAAEICVFPLLMRVRQIGEHGVALDRTSRDPRDNTATTLVSPIEALLVAPNNVNYHLEHHQFATVPGYNLAKLHRMLKARGYYEGRDCISHGYLEVLRKAVRPDDAAPAMA